jgi:excinuclease UvrABC ATPase subunit
MATIAKICGGCKGDGLADISIMSGGGTVQCPHCDGSGSFDDSMLDISNLEDKVNDILGKVNDIFEKLTEE